MSEPGGNKTDTHTITAPGAMLRAARLRVEPRQLLQIALLAAVYFLVGRIGLDIPSDAYTLNIAVVCSPAGIALAAILRFGRPMTAGVWLGAFLVNASIGLPLPVAAAVATGSTLAPLVGATLMRWGEMRADFERQQDVLTFFIVAIVAMGIGAMIGTASLHLAGLLPQAQMRSALLYWWLGDAIGTLVVAPPLMIFSGKALKRPKGVSRLAEAVVSVGGMLVAAAAIFGALRITDAPQALTFIPYVFLVWIALRLGTWVAALSVLALAFCAILGTALGTGAFATADSRIGIAALWSYIAASAGITLLIAALHAERNQADRELRESEARFCDFTHALADWFWEMDKHGRLSYVAGNVEGVLGYTADELLDKSFADLSRGDDAVLAVQVFEHAFAARRPLREIEIWVPHKEGGLRCLRTNGMPILDAENQFAGYRGAFEDITAQRKADESQRLAATVFENSTEAIIITDANAKIVSVNAAFTRITGYELDKVAGQYPSYLRSGYAESDIYESIWAGLRSRGHWHGEAWDHKKSGEAFIGLLSISAVRDERGEITNFVAIFSDISTIRKNQDDLRHIAHHDALTALPNRVLLDLRLTHALERAKRAKRKAAVLLLDLDGFKVVNDSLGHAAGDLLLQTVARRLTEVVREEDTVARLGGDEFAVVLEHLKHDEDAVLVAKKLRDAVAQPVSLEHGQSALLDVSIGIALYPDDGESGGLLLRNADAAMYEAKGMSPGGYRFYRPELTEAAQVRFMLESALRRAMAQNELEVWYQPQISLANGSVVGAEALLRWRHPQRGLLLPGEFIRLAEETRLIVPLGEWVLRRACVQAREWRERKLDFGKMSVNVSAAQIERSDLAGLVHQVLEETGLPGDALEIEISEGSLLHSAEYARRTTGIMRALGAPLAIDDFGTGYSSLSYLKQLPVVKLMIDQSFICGLPGDTEAAAICRGIIALGHSLGLTVLAEAVETEAQREFLLAEGCDEAQGFHYCPALPAAEFEAWISSRQAALN